MSEAIVIEVKKKLQALDRDEKKKFFAQKSIGKNKHRMSEEEAWVFAAEKRKLIPAQEESLSSSDGQATSAEAEVTNFVSEVT
ncbi:MAG: hypothetical protein EOP04_03305, partial [Proteobacteria bacterium]